MNICSNTRFQLLEFHLNGRICILLSWFSNIQRLSTIEWFHCILLRIVQNIWCKILKRLPKLKWHNGIFISENDKRNHNYYYTPNNICIYRFRAVFVPRVICPKTKPCIRTALKRTYAKTLSQLRCRIIYTLKLCDYANR